MLSWRLVALLHVTLWDLLLHMTYFVVLVALSCLLLACLSLLVSEVLELLATIFLNLMRAFLVLIDMSLVLGRRLVLLLASGWLPLFLILRIDGVGSLLASLVGHLLAQVLVLHRHLVYVLRNSRIHVV